MLAAPALIRGVSRRGPAVVPSRSSVEEAIGEDPGAAARDLLRQLHNAGVCETDVNLVALRIAGLDYTEAAKAAGIASAVAARVHVWLRRPTAARRHAHASEDLVAVAKSGAC